MLCFKCHCKACEAAHALVVSGDVEISIHYYYCYCCLRLYVLCAVVVFCAQTFSRARKIAFRVKPNTLVVSCDTTSGEERISLPIQAELRLCSTFFSVSPVTCFRLFVNELSLVRLCLFARRVCRILLRQFRTKERRSRVCSAFAPRLPLTLPPAVHDRMISVHVSAAWHFSFVVCCATFSGERMIPVYVFLTRYRCTVLRNSRL